MQITKETVEYAANLSRIKLDESETEEMRSQISEIVEYMEILNQLAPKDDGNNNQNNNGNNNGGQQPENNNQGGTGDNAGNNGGTNNQ